jgi:uncharacterized protein YtpQ (UPF0354 family)
MMPRIRCRSFLLAGLALAAVAFVPALVRAAAPRDQARFTEYVVAKLRAAMPGAKFTIREPLVIGVYDPDTGTATASPERVWRYCSVNSEAACEQAIGYWIAGIKAPPVEDRKVDRSKIRAVVRTAKVLADYAVQLRRPIVMAPLAGDLRIACVIDLPTNLSYLGEPDLKELGLSQEEAIALGIRNVAANLKSLSDVLMGDPAAPWGHSDGDDYESGRILLHEDLAELSQAWGDRLIIAIPGTHTVLYADGRRPDALAKMRDAVKVEMTHSERAISSTLLLWTKTGWEVIPPMRVTIPPVPAAGSTARRSRVSESGPPGRRRGRRRRRHALPRPCAGDRALSRPPS